MGGRGARLGVATAVLLALAASSSGAHAATPRTWPFAAPRELRGVRPSDALPSLYADGRACSTGCRAAGAVPGWPVKPFRGRHLLVAGLNELRGSNLHFGVDILARDGTPVHAVQGGRVEEVVHAGRDSRVRVGAFEYWHVRPSVAPGQAVSPHGGQLGTIIPGEGHLHFSELSGGRY